MKFSEMFPNATRYLKGSDLKDGEKIVGEISHVERRVIGRDASVTKPVLVFSNDCSPLILNETQARALCKALGDDSTMWASVRVELRGLNGVTMDGKDYRTIDIKVLASVPQEERQAAIEAARETEAEREEAEAAAAKAKRPKLAMDINLNDEVPY
jgi:hypothetical protein